MPRKLTRNVLAALRSLGVDVGGRGVQVSDDLQLTAELFPVAAGDTRLREGLRPGILPPYPHAQSRVTGVPQVNPSFVNSIQLISGAAGFRVTSVRNLDPTFNLRIGFATGIPLMTPRPFTTNGGGPGNIHPITSVLNGSVGIIGFTNLHYLLRPGDQWNESDGPIRGYPAGQTPGGGNDEFWCEVIAFTDSMDLNIAWDEPPGLV